jgi:autotransporter-associated beta strand protein
VIGLPTTGGLLPGTGSGTPNPALFGNGTVTLTASNTFFGGVVLDGGTLNINGEYALGGANYGGITFNGGTLQYATSLPGTNGTADISQTSGGVAEPVVFAGAANIDVNGNTVTYANGIGNGGSGSLTVASTSSGGSLTLAGVNTFTGSTTVTGTLILTGSLTTTRSVAINGGVADLNAPDALNQSAHLTLAAGTLAALANETEALGDLTLGAGASTLSLGATGTVIDFADSGLDTWSGALAIAGWNGNGTDLSGGGSDQVIFANDNLSGSQLRDITFVNPTIDGVAKVGSYTAAQLPSGEIVAAAAVPEPGAWGMMIAGAGMLLVWQRSRRNGRVSKVKRNDA